MPPDPLRLQLHVSCKHAKKKNFFQQIFRAVENELSIKATGQDLISQNWSKRKQMVTSGAISPYQQLLVGLYKSITESVTIG